MRRLVLSSALMLALASASAMAQSTVPKTTDQIPPPAVLPTLPMTAPAVVVPKMAAPVAAPPVTAPPLPAASITPAPKAAAPAVPFVVPAAKVAAPAAKAVKPAPTAKATTKSAPVSKSCTRLPLSDIQFGRENTIKVAREKLEEYAQKVAKDKGWKGYTRSAETATCEDYLWLPLGGQEYKCLVTATYCSK